MRILSVGNRYPPWSTGGYERTWASTVAALRAAGHEVRVLTTLPDPSDLSVSPGSAAGDVRRELAWYWRDHVFAPLGWRRCAALERHNAGVLAHHLGDLAPDAVMWWAMGGMSLSLLEQARRADVPAVAVVGDDWLVYGPRVDAWTRAFAGRVRWAAPAAERVVGVPARLAPGRAARWSMNSQSTLRTAVDAGWQLPVASIAHPGVDPSRFPAAAAGEWSWRLLYCGRIDSRKGIETAVRALALLPEPATLRIHGEGDGRHRIELEALAAGLGVAERVTFDAGAPDAVAAVYAAGDVVVFPVTWREPWGLVPLEAMAVGRPVVATRAGGGPAEYLQDGVNCLQFSPRDAEQLAEAIRRLADDPALREALVRDGARTAARFTEDAFHDALIRELELTVRAGPL
jgi:glycogen(starch) synthase